MDETDIKEVERESAAMIKRMTEEWDWDLAGGNWPIDGGLLDDLLEIERGLERFVQTGVKHTVHKPPRWYWRRVYDDEGNPDYELTEEVNKSPYKMPIAPDRPNE